MSVLPPRDEVFQQDVVVIVLILSLFWGTLLLMALYPKVMNRRIEKRILRLEKEDNDD